MSADTPRTEAEAKKDAVEHAEEGVVIAEGVDQEPAERNRRLFEGRTFLLVATIAAVYAAFHMAALNGISLRGVTGGVVNVPYLPRLPMETWTFRILHVAGALLLGFVLFSPTRFDATRRDATRPYRHRLRRLCADGAGDLLAWGGTLV